MGNESEAFPMMEATETTKLGFSYPFTDYRGVHQILLPASFSFRGPIRVVTSLVPEATGVLQAPSLVA
jgi:hypothetical protein